MCHQLECPVELPKSVTALQDLEKGCLPGDSNINIWIKLETKHSCKIYLILRDLQNFDLCWALDFYTCIFFYVPFTFFSFYFSYFVSLRLTEKVIYDNYSDLLAQGPSSCFKVGLVYEFFSNYQSIWPR